MTTIIHFTNDGKPLPECGRQGCDAEHHPRPKGNPLDQDAVWTTRDGETMLLEDMTISHRANLVNWLRRNAQVLLLRYEMEIPGSIFAPSGDAAQDAFERACEEWERDPVAWVNSTRLVRRLTELNEQARSSVVSDRPVA